MTVMRSTAWALRHEVGHHAVDALMGVKREVIGAELGGGIGDGDRVEHHGAEDRDLGLDRGREPVVLWRHVHLVPWGAPDFRQGPAG